MARAKNALNIAQNPPPRVAAPHYPHGLVLLAGWEGVGKTDLAYMLALAVGGGVEQWLSQDVVKGRAVYLNKRRKIEKLTRYQVRYYERDRATGLRGVDDFPALAADGMDSLRAYLSGSDAAALVVLDDFVGCVGYDDPLYVIQAGEDLAALGKEAGALILGLVHTAFKTPPRGMTIFEALRRTLPGGQQADHIWFVDRKPGARSGTLRMENGVKIGLAYNTMTGYLPWAA